MGETADAAGTNPCTVKILRRTVSVNQHGTYERAVEARFGRLTVVVGHAMLEFSPFDSSIGDL